MEAPGAEAPRSIAVRERIEAPKAPMEVRCGEGVSHSPPGKEYEKGAVPPLQKSSSIFELKKASFVHSGTDKTYF